MSATDLDLPRFACPDWWQRIQAGQTPMAHVPLDEVRAAKALAFFNRLRLPDISGNPTMAEACGQWFKDILVAFLASADPVTGQQIVGELLCMVPKKNSKTTYVAALGLTALFLDESPNRQMLIVAPSHNISERCFAQAQGMIRLDPKLEAIFQVRDHLKSIIRRKTGTKLNVKTFDTAIVTGEIPVLTIIDEVHQLGGKANAAAVMQQIRGGGITRKGGQVLMITTQSDESPAGVWRTELDKARAIRAGKGGPAPVMLPVLYEFPQELQRDQEYWREPVNWDAITPNMGLSIDRDRLIADYRNNGTANREAEQIWASQHLNIEIGVGLSVDTWAGAEHWEASTDAKISLAAIIARCEVAVVGIDGGGLDDLLGLGVIGREKGSGRWLSWAHAWAHPEVLTRRKEIAPRLRQFAQDGDLTIVDRDDPTGDVDELCAIVAQLVAAQLLPEKDAIGLDPYGIGAIVDALARIGVTGPQMTGIGQGARLSPAVWGMERKLKDRTMRHADQPMMQWVVGNARAEQRGNAVIINKEQAGKAKIDPLVALFCAFMLMTRHPQAARVQDIGKFLAAPIVAMRRRA